MKKLILVLFIVLLITGCGTTESKYTMNQYKQVKSNMKYKEVIKILGPGEEAATLKQDNIKITSYSWQNSNGSNIQIMFQNDKVYTKAQAGLK